MTRDELKQAGLDYIDIESWNGDAPENWEEIAERLNEIIDTRANELIKGVSDELETRILLEDSNLANDVWEKHYCNA
jgi:hypothetical protein